ncbi:MAG: hypothetical protein KBD64_03525 [Gammaproteobacteria bacterium]|nr:hypothetical protein [Gammaproteobacteria bacterium]
MPKYVSRMMFGLLIILWLFGCTSNTYLEAEKSIEQMEKKSKSLLNPAHVVVTDEAYIDNKPIFAEYNPAWTDREVSVDLNNNSIKLKSLMGQLFKDTGDIRVVYQEGIDDVDIKDIAIDGKLINVIKEISKKVNYHYVIEEKVLTWTPRMTRIFQLGVLPGEVNYTMGGPGNSSSTGFGSTVGSEAKGGDVTYKNSAGGSVWETLTKTLDQLVSKTNGSYVINKDASVVTVVDRPNNMDAVADFIKKFNNYHMQQVGIKIQVLEIELNDEHKRGIDWALVKDSINSKTRGRFNFARSVSPLASNFLDTDSFTFLFNKKTGDWAGSQLLLQYLEQQGNLSVLSEPRFTILNNQIAEIKITSDQGYVKSRKNTLTSLGTTQVALEPGSIKTGFSLYVVPTIFDTEVLLQITTSISRRVSLDSFSTAGPNSDTQDLQLPTISDRRFTQRSVIPNNSTLVLTGFKTVQNATGDLVPFEVNAIGGQTATNKTTEIVLLITPVIIRG